MATIKNTHYNYSLNIVHHGDYGNIFIGEYDPETKTYPCMTIRHGECFDLQPSELIGAYLYDGICLGLDKERKI